MAILGYERSCSLPMGEPSNVGLPLPVKDHILTQRNRTVKWFALYIFLWYTQHIMGFLVSLLLSVPNHALTRTNSTVTSSTLCS